jgi:hypothetical protein
MSSILDRLLRLARALTFLIAIAFSVLAIYSYIATAVLVIHNPGLVLPDDLLWTVEQLENALLGLGLPGNFYVIFSLVTGFVFSLVFLACGWLILLRKNQDWFGLFLALLLLGWANGYNAFVSLPSAIPWFDTLFSYLSWFLWPGLFFLLYLFPSGHVTPRWARWFALVWGIFSIYGLVASALDRLPDNFILFFPILIVVLLVGGYAQIYRYRHAAAIERQQIKWVVMAFLLMVVSFIIIIFLVNLTGLGDPNKSSLTGALVFQIFSSTLGNIVFMGVPISIVLAMLRYRLWDVDIIIRRTLVYGGLSFTLALVFFGGVTLLQQVFGALTGTENSHAAIVISTLLIAALFNPLRRRIQYDIDRRFYRRKYNAEKALARFAASARNEADIDHLTGELQAVVQDAIQPEQIVLWLKPQPTKKNKYQVIS